MPNLKHNINNQHQSASGAHSSSKKLLGPADNMPDYDFSTRAGFQLAMKHALTSTSVDEIKAYAEATVTPSFYHIMNGKRREYDEWFGSLESWSGKITDYEPEV